MKAPGDRTQGTQSFLILSATEPRSRSPPKPFCCSRLFKERAGRGKRRQKRGPRPGSQSEAECRLPLQSQAGRCGDCIKRKSPNFEDLAGDSLAKKGSDESCLHSEVMSPDTHDAVILCQSRAGKMHWRATVKAGVDNAVVSQLRCFG